MCEQIFAESALKADIAKIIPSRMDISMHTNISRICGLCFAARQRTTQPKFKRIYLHINSATKAALTSQS